MREFMENNAHTEYSENSFQGAGTKGLKGGGESKRVENPKKILKWKF